MVCLVTRRVKLELAALGLLIAGCAGCSPTEPSGASDGVTIYQHPNYRGDSRRFAGDERDLKAVVGCSGGSWDDCISSMRIPEGWQATVYEDPNYRGGFSTFTSDVPDLDRVMGPCSGDWENCISSIRVSRQ